MVGFLNSIVLYGLAAAAIPLLVHLLARPRIKRIPFSSLRFLRVVQNESSRRIRLKKLLLLALRTAAVISLVIAFARPVIRSTAPRSMGGSGRVSAWVVDNSLSMQREGLWTRVRRATEELAQAMDGGDRVLLFWTAPTGWEAPPDSTLRADEALMAVQRKSPAWTAGRPLNALWSAAAALNGLRAGVREIVLLSDLQASDFPAGADTSGLGAWTGQVFVVPVSDSRANTAVTWAELETPPPTAESPLRIAASVSDFGGSTSTDRLVRIHVNGQAVAQRTFSMVPGGIRTESVPVPFPGGGWVWGKVQAETDAFPQDDERHFCAFVPERTRILLVGGAPEDVRPFALALAPDSRISSRFEIQEGKADGEWADALDRADALFLSNIPRLSRRQAQACRAFLEQGGGVLFVPGPDTDLENANASLFGPLWGDTLAALPFRQDRSLHYSVALGHADTPMLQGVFEKGAVPVQQPRLVRAIRLSGPRFRTSVPISTGIPFLAELRFGNGGLAFWASGPRQDWSDLALHPVFAPLVVRSAIVLSSFRSGEAVSVMAGDSLAVRLPPGASGRACRVDLPSGERVALVPRLRSSRLELALSRADTPGLYTFFAGGAVIGMAAVNTDPSESDFITADESAISRRLPKAQIVMLNGRESLAGQIRLHRVGREFWREMLAAALLFLAAEMLVAALWK